MRIATLVAALALLAPAAQAAAPQPRKPVEISKFLGRWYEQARTPNPKQKNCFSPTMEWHQVAEQRYSVVQTCRRDSPRGPPQVWKGSAKVVDQRTRAKLDVGFLGGLVRQEYWVLDHGDDYSWAIVGTPGGNYIWVLTRAPRIDEATRAELKLRVRALGYDPDRLEYAAS
jgi:apolipoprotein D and lipocalin family protein